MLFTRFFSIFLLLSAALCGSLNAYHINEEFTEDFWHFATRTGNIDIIEKFIINGFDVDSFDYNKSQTSLMYAINSGNIEAVKLLVSAGTDVNKISNGKSYAIVEALKYPEVLEFLIESGADLNVKLSQKKNLLHFAANPSTNHPERAFKALQILLEDGRLDVNASDLFGITPLHLAVSYKNHQHAFTLLEYGADMHAMDDYGWAPLHRVFQQCDITLLKEFIRRGGSPNDCSPDGNALHHACARTSAPGCFTLIKYLIEELKMDVNAHSISSAGIGGPTAFMSAIGCQMAFEDNFEILEYLLKSGADFKEGYYFYDNGKKYVVHDSALTWAIAIRLPRYIIEWMRQNGAK